MKLFTLLCLLPGLLSAQSFLLTPSAPKAGDLVRIEVDLSKSKLKSAAEIETIVLEYANNKAAVTDAATMRSGDKIISVFTLAPNALSAVIAFRAGEEAWENNQGEGYFVTIHAADGKAIPEGMAAAAVLYRDYGGLMNLNRTPSVALDLLNKGISVQPELKRKYFAQYAQNLMAVKKNDD